jgi:hypothetical protein
MDLESLVLSAAIGALAGAVGWFVTRKAKEAKWAKIVGVASVVVGITVGQEVVAPIARDRKIRREIHAAALDTYGNEDAAELHTNILHPIIADSRFQRRIKQRRSDASANSSVQLGGMQTGVAELVAAGMIRLDTSDLAAIFEVKRALADKSPALCAGLWTGQISPANLKEGIRALTKEQQTIWITVSGSALAREIAADGAAPETTGAAGHDEMAELTRTLSPEQQAVFAAAAQGAPTQDVACQAFRALAAGLQNLTAEKRGTILRMLDTAPAVGKQ